MLNSQQRLRHWASASILARQAISPTPLRITNTYYSNLIEGHDTRPREIERALAGELDRNEGRRNLQLEAAAHVRVQREVDRMLVEGVLPAPACEAFIKWLHLEFYRDAPEVMLLIEHGPTKFLMQPGEWRSRPGSLR